MSPEAPVDLVAMYHPIREEVDRLGTFLKAEFASREPFIYRILQHISQFGGKQIRPALLFLTHRFCGGHATDDLVKIGGVIEMIHTATLVHDDLLDSALLRRQMETVHRRWGDRAAVLIGDHIYARAFQLSTEVPGMAGLLSATTRTICEGELLQIAHRHEPDLDEDTYFEIIRKKTAVLYAVASEIGGRFAGLDPALSQLLYRYGMDLGMAFQIIDDCLDYSGKEQIVGKSLGTDLHQGKVTLPLIYLREVLPPPERAWLERSLHGPLCSQEENRIQELVRDHGVISEALSRARGFIEGARSALGELGAALGSVDPRVRECLEMVTEYVLKRQR